MLKKLRKKLDLNWIKKNTIWDVVIYGSYVRGKTDARDIDIAIILSESISVAKKMVLCQELRHMLSEAGYVLDIKAVDIEDFLNAGFLGREAIFAEGSSLLKGDYLAERFGFTACALVQYSLKRLTQSKKKMFYYALQGRKRGSGLLAQINGKILSKGILQLPIRHYEELKALLGQHDLDYVTTFALQYRIIH